MASTIDNGVLTVEVIHYDGKVVNADRSKVVLDSRLFKVSQETLIEKSQYFETRLASSYWQENPRAIIPPRASHVLAMDVYFRVIHKGTSIFTLTIPEVWHLAEAVKFCQTHLKYFKDWVSGWYNAMGMLLLELNPRSLVYPCWRFDHAQSFLDATEYLVYNSVGHLTEQNPVNLVEHHLPPRIIQQLNAAKGQFKSLLLDGLFGPSHETLWSDLPLQERDGI